MSDMDVYALKQPSPDGSEWIQEHDSLDDAVRYQSHSGGVLVKRGELPGEPGLWWIEVPPPRAAKPDYDSPEVKEWCYDCLWPLGPTDEPCPCCGSGRTIPAPGDRRVTPPV